MSGEIEGTAVEVRAVTDGAAAERSGVAHELELLALAEAMVRGDQQALTTARAAALGALGPEGYVEAAAVASNFERMVRIADATGIPLDAPLDTVSAGMRADLGIDDFGSSANTPRVSPGRRALGRLLAPFARYFMTTMAARSRRAALRHEATTSPDSPSRAR